MDTAATCPFSSRCIIGRSGAAQLDTGVLDSHTHLGINARRSDRVGFRIMATCSILGMANLTRTIPDPFLKGNASIIEVYMGEYSNLTQNYTFSYSEMDRGGSYALQYA